MSFPRYPEYKDSGVEWLGQVPAHWSTVATKRLFNIVGGSTPPSDTPAFWDGEIPWVTPADLSAAVGQIHDTQRTITAAGVAACGTTLAPAGSIIISTRAPIGSLAVSARAMCTNQGCKILVPTSRVLAGYFSRVFASATAELNVRGRGSTFLEISSEEIGRFLVPVPPPHEQAAIANFLDRETAKIDALVAEQERLIALLKEKRQAVISHAITKGLNPDAPMKDSGVEWFGAIPAHWHLDRLQLHCEFISGRAHEPFVEDDGEHLCVTSRFVSTGGAAERRCTVNLEAAACGDSLVVMSDLPNGRALAKAYFVADNRSYAINQRVCALRSTTADPRFLFYLVDRNPELLRHDDGVNQTHLSNGDFLKPRFPFPPREEQATIARYLDAETGRSSELMLDSARVVAVLNERRAALITAAVTGQIDVRGFTPVEAA